MASADTTPHDPLLLLRQSIASDSPAIPTTTTDATSAAAVDLSLAHATYLQFFQPTQTSIPLTTPTRFTSSDKAVDLRSIYFAWLRKDDTIPEYTASAQALNAELGAEGGAGGEVNHLAFVERLDLITWLEGASEESEYIKPLASETSSAEASALVASGVKGGIAPVASGTMGRQGKGIDPRLAEIYNGERRMGDRNSVLRGIKPTACSLPWLTRTHADTMKGFLSRPQAGRAVLFQESDSQHRQQRFHGHQLQDARPPPRPHHPALSLRLVPPAHVEHQILPGERPLRAPGLQHDVVQHLGLHPPHLALRAIRRPFASHPLHHRRGAGAVQAGILVARRRRLHHRPDVAIQELQVAAPHRVVPTHPRRLCWLER